ncbi:MAG: hypothetical protein MR850_01745 [Bacteroidales bacterium]|nr:hypothetical protein [Bacteroidales bacterium]
MKKITIILLLVFFNIVIGFCQKSEKFLVFTFNCVYEIGEYKHGTGDNLWIIPYDSCLTNFSDRIFSPLFADDDLINSLSDSITNSQSFGYFPTADYESNSNALKILKNRRKIQSRTTKFFFKNSTEQLDIYLTPIIAECRSHEFGFYKECVYTISDTLEIWKDFWDKTDNRILQLILNHDFSKFGYRVSISQKEQQP